MPNEKLFTAKQAATAVLAKAQEMLVKADMMQKKPADDKTAPAEKPQDSKDGVLASPDPARTQPLENGNPAPGALPQNEQKYGAEGKTKGPIKLAKFVGAMEQKRKAKVVAAPAPAPAPVGKPKV